MINLQELKNKLKKIQEKKPARVIWKPTDEHSVRVLPLPGEEDLAEIVKWHYGVDQGRKMYCPTTVGDECPFCLLGQYLKSWRDENGREKSEAERKRDWEWYKKIEPATKHYAPIVVRKKDSTDVEGPFWWEMTPKVYASLIKICADDDYNEDHPEGGVFRILTSLEHALDLTVILKKRGEKGNTTNFDLTEVEERKKFSPIFKGDRKAAEELVKKITPLADVHKVVTTEEAEKIFATWKTSMDESPADESAGGEMDYNGEKPATGGSDTDDVIAQLTQMISD